MSGRGGSLLHELGNVDALFTGEVGVDELVDLARVDLVADFIDLEGAVEAAVYHEFDVDEGQRVQFVEVEEVE